MRLRKKKTRRQVEELLPEDDGLIKVLVTRQDKFGLTKTWEYRTPEEISEHCQRQMANHDSRSLLERWGGNQWGEGWALYPDRRNWFQARQPPLATDASYDAYAEIADAPRIKGRKSRGRAKSTLWDKIAAGAAHRLRPAE